MRKRIATALMFVSAAALQHAPTAGAATAPETTSAGVVYRKRAVAAARGGDA